MVHGATALGDAAKFIEEGEELAILARLCDGPGCFVAGTPVQTIIRGEDGRFHLLVKPIERVSKGNLVLARDEKTGRTQVRRVLRTTVRHVDKVLTVALADAKTHKVVERITATREHPFYVRRKGFTPAGGLAVGNAIVTRAGPALVVQSVTWRRRAEGYTVHNFVVEDDHSYFVGTHGGGAWVHNGEGDCLKGIGGLFGKSESAILDAAPKGWRRVITSNAVGRTNGWKLLDANGVERVRFMRPEDNAAKIQWYRQKFGYWRWQSAAGDFLDENGNVVPANHPEFNELTHIIYSGR